MAAMYIDLGIVIILFAITFLIGGYFLIKKLNQKSLDRFNSSSRIKKRANLDM